MRIQKDKNFEKKKKKKRQRRLHDRYSLKLTHNKEVIHLNTPL